MLTPERLKELQFSAASKGAHLSDAAVAVNAREMADICDLALRGLNAGDQWRTMESAPKDQTILISGHWDDGKGWVGEAIWCASGYDEGWAADKEGFERGETYMQPDHWQPMPLPTPPAMKEKPC